MGRRFYTEEQAKQKCIDVGIEMIGSYLGAWEKTVFQCPFCPKLFETKPARIWQKHTTSCGCYLKKFKTKEEILQKIKEQNLEILEDFTLTHQKYTFKCLKCGNENYKTRLDYVLCGDTSSCGCTKYDKSKELKITEEEVIERCKTLDVKYIRGFNGVTKLATFLCLNCNNEFECKPYNVFSGGTKTCGNCQKKRNGVTTSEMALRIHHLIDPNEDFSIHNYQSECGNVDIFIPNINLIIEIDCAFWHKGMEDRDNKKHQKIIEENYKLLVLRIGNRIPQKIDIDYSIFNSIFNKYFVFTSSDWKTCVSFKECTKIKNDGV